ncbi:MAG: EAL domain-containing protein [Geminicoccaceae bacterium]|nr:EAL domain-containing protein [Geminicoccaceae bacterium]
MSSDRAKRHSHDTDGPSPADPRIGADQWRRRASNLAIAAGIIGYLSGFIPAMADTDFDTAFLNHLAVRGISCAFATLALLAGIIITRPTSKLPWIMLLILIASFTLRPLTMHTGHIMLWNGWLIFMMLALQGGAAVAALAAVIRLRKTDSITDTRLEVAIILIAYTAVVIPFVAVPGWMAYDLLPLALGLGVVAPAGYVFITGLVARLIFIDILRGRAFRLLMAGWLLMIGGDVIVHNVIELSGWAIGAAAFDVYPLSSFLWVAACLAPSAEDISRPATEARGDWSAIRSFAIVTAAALPLVVGIFADDASMVEEMIVATLGIVILVLLIIRARIAVAAYAESEKSLIELSRTDPLTRLLNRRGLINHAMTETRPIGVAYIDIDGFKLLNDVHGHDYGDRLLIEVGQRLDSIAKPVVATARIGGDEFATLFANTSKGAVDQTRRAIENAFKAEFLMCDRPVRVTASAGLATADYSGHADDAPPAPTRHELLELLRKADIAQYYAKSSGGDCSRYYTEAMHVERARQERIIDALKVVGNDDLFYLDYQAIVDLGGGEIVSAEALARLHSPDLDNVSPDDFVPLAEKHGYINALGDWVFHSVLTSVELAVDTLPGNFRISVNVSPLQLGSDHLVHAALSAAIDKPEAAARIRIEVTESAFVDDDSLARLTKLKKAGYSIAIDDFGSEYASLQYLARLDVDTLKLDRSFTSLITTELRTRKIVQHIIDLASEMNIIVIAEGIETAAQHETLASMGCHFGQGFLWDRPARSLDRILAKYRGGPSPWRAGTRMAQPTPPVQNPANTIGATSMIRRHPSRSGPT